MAIVYRQQASLESRMRFIETAAQSVERRLESIELWLDQLEQAQSTLPELLDLLKPEQLSHVHQTMVRRCQRVGLSSYPGLVSDATR
jgi:hypothetical protein